jgi:hypothetical protein
LTNFTPSLTDNTKLSLWQSFVSSNRVAQDCVPLFAMAGGQVETLAYGKDGRQILERSGEMNALMRGLGSQLVQEYQSGDVRNSGILYMMLSHEGESVVPLYIGKAEIYGKGDKNLSVNISDLISGDGKFGRWGYNYAYHLGDLSAVTLPGHAESKRTIKYEAWRDALFELTDGAVRPKRDIRFWARIWGPDCQSVWRGYGQTRLAFEEYLLIGVASDLFQDHLLNREGRNR